MIDTVLFDFDGTLVDTNELIISSWQYTYEAYWGRQVPREDIIKTFGEPLEMSMKKIFPEVDSREAVAKYKEFQKDKFVDLISICTGMDKLVLDLKTKNLKLGVVTSRLMDSTTIGLKNFNLTSLFDVVITADDTDKHKPDPEPINIALGKLKSKAENTMMIGDTKYDIGCANNAGVVSVLVNWGITDVDYTKDIFVPDYTIDKATEVYDIIMSKQ